MRAKQVFSGREVFDKWANGLATGRNSQGNMSFREGFAYSYANPLQFHVAHIGSSSSWESGYTLIDGLKLNHKRNLDDYASRIEDSAAALAKSRSHIDSRLMGLRCLVEEANRYARYFHLKTRLEVPELDLETLHERERRWEEANEARIQAARVRYEAQAAQTRLDNVEKIAAWIKGEPVYLPYGLDRDYLRTE